jgi:hypothetical protein
MTDRKSVILGLLALTTSQGWFMIIPAPAVLQAARVLLCIVLHPSQRQGHQQRPALPSQYSVWSIEEKAVRENISIKLALLKCDRSVDVK